MNWVGKPDYATVRKTPLVERAMFKGLPNIAGLPSQFPSGGKWGEIVL